MTQIIRLEPHDPIPSSPGRHVVVLHQFDEEAPKATVTTITLTGLPDERVHPVGSDGKPLTLDQAIDAARQVAESEKIDRVYVVDRTQGEREHNILERGGDHSIDGEKLVDFDLEDGERGPDMRKRSS